MTACGLSPHRIPQVRQSLLPEGCWRGHAPSWQRHVPRPPSPPDEAPLAARPNPLPQPQRPAPPREGAGGCVRGNEAAAVGCGEPAFCGGTGLSSFLRPASPRGMEAKAAAQAPVGAVSAAGSWMSAAAGPRPDEND